ncbi:MAG: transposase, partial [Rickettsiaceae bacterium]|nr:transposase [Rickettsiaceae bacterium]
IDVKLGFQNFYMYSAVDPESGEDFSLILPSVNTNCMNLFLKEMSQQIGKDNIIMVMDGAGWYHSKDLKIPPNIEIVHLPAYSPELNPVERLWLYIKQKIIKNTI